MDIGTLDIHTDLTGVVVTGTFINATFHVGYMTIFVHQVSSLPYFESVTMVRAEHIA